LKNYGIGNRGGVYEKVQTRKSGPPINMHLRIMTLEFDVESFPAALLTPQLR
jgi:hypothetical protein